MLQLSDYNFLSFTISTEYKIQDYHEISQAMRP